MMQCTLNDKVTLNDKGTLHNTVYIKGFNLH